MSEENTNIKIPIHVSEEDYINFNIFHSTMTENGKKSIKKTINITYIAILIAFLISFLNIDSTDRMSRAIYIVCILVVLVIILVCVKVFSRKITEHLIRRNIERLKEKGPLPYESSSLLTIESDRLISEGSNSTLNINLKDILQVYEQPDYYFIYFGAVQAIILPKRDTIGYDNQIKTFLGI